MKKKMKFSPERDETIRISKYYVFLLYIFSMSQRHNKIYNFFIRLVVFFHEHSKNLFREIKYILIKKSFSFLVCINVN
jgi:hypothetical protein